MRMQWASERVTKQSNSAISISIRFVFIQFSRQNGTESNQNWNEGRMDWNKA